MATWQETYQLPKGKWGYAVYDHGYSDSFPAACGRGYPDELSAMRDATAAKRDLLERQNRY